MICDFKEKFNTFMYGMMCVVWQTIIGFQSCGWDVTFLENPRKKNKKNTPICVHLVC
jgi:hypothetical protein